MNDNRPIGIFDSGVGGLSVLREIQKLLPNESIVYLADQANVPYGNKNSEELRHLTEKGVDFLVKKKVKIIILACNSATVHALDHLRTKLKIPIIGIVPVVKAASEVTKNRRIGILSTIATSKSDYLKVLIEKFASGFNVLNIGTDKLVPYVERGEIEGDRLNKTLIRLLRVFKQGKIDTLTLGCSHFLFLRNIITKNLPGIVILDSGAAISRQTKRILTKEDWERQRKGADIFLTTGEPATFKKVAEKLLGYGVDRVYKARL